MDRGKIFLLLALLGAGLPPNPAPARLITFLDFDWGKNCGEVELQAGGKGYRLLKKNLDLERRELVYKTTLLDRECTVTFFFTPLTDRMFSARVVWEGTSFGYILLEQLKKLYQTPREEMPQFKTYIWTRKNTEVELRHDEENTVLIYSNLNLWTGYREELKALKEQNQEE